MAYACPMHPEVRQENPGRCPMCGMKLVLEEKAESQEVENEQGLGPATWKSYLPLFVVVGVILVTAAVISFRQYGLEGDWLRGLLINFMAGFFLTFATFKLMDLKGFASGYFTYDLLARRVFSYGYVYPFLELGFGLAMVASYHLEWVLWAELILMLFSGTGVAIKIAKKEKFQCVCLGTFLKVPLTKVTLIEDFGMAAIAGILLLWG